MLCFPAIELDRVQGESEREDEIQLAATTAFAATLAARRSVRGDAQDRTSQMHELSIAQGLIEVACEALSGCEPPPVRVRSVLIRVGALSGVVPEALQFCYGLSVQGTPLEGSRLSVEEQPVVVFCPRCLENRILQDASRFRCPVCDTLTPQLIHGRELELISMEVIDHDEQTSGCPDDLDPGAP
jgi:hydrogenase nickel incorporation protein HypA/HybF